MRYLLTKNSLFGCLRSGFATLLCCSAVCLLPNIALSDPIYHLYGITHLNKLVEIDPLDPLLDQREVASFSSANMVGLEYDVGLDRIIGLDSSGNLYSVNQTTAATTFLKVFTTTNGPFYGLGFDITVSPPRLYTFADGTQLPTLLVAAGREPFSELNTINYFGENLLGLTIDPIGGALYGINNQFQQTLATVNKTSGALERKPNTLPGNITGIAIHPSTGLLYGTSADGTLVQVHKTTGVSTTLKAYPSNQNVAVSDLAFIPVTPTPTPTPTATPTTTPTITPTPCPTTPNGCACNQVDLVLRGGDTVCAPVDTLTKRTVPDAPKPQVQGNSVTLVLEEFSAVSDGTSLDLLPSASVRGKTAFEEAVAEARRRKATVRYDVTITNTSSRTRDARNKQSKRNQVTFRRVPPGNYTSRYRVKIVRGNKEVGNSKFSPRARFKVRNRRG